jgi:hypothetical protein
VLTQLTKIKNKHLVIKGKLDRVGGWAAKIPRKTRGTSTKTRRLRFQKGTGTGTKAGRLRFQKDTGTGTKTRRLRFQKGTGTGTKAGRLRFQETGEILARKPGG